MTATQTLAAAILAVAAFAAPALAQTPDPARFITAGPFNVRILANGVDVTSRSPVAVVRYQPDGQGWRRLRDGRTVTGQWQFLNAERTQIQVNGPEGPSRWVIVELNERIYRKVNIDTGLEFIHTPVAE